MKINGHKKRLLEVHREPNLFVNVRGKRNSAFSAQFFIDVKTDNSFNPSGQMKFSSNDFDSLLI